MGGTSCQGSWTFTGDPQWHHAMVVVVFDVTFGQASLFGHGEDLGVTSGAAFPYGASILAGDYARAGTCGGVPAARAPPPRPREGPCCPSWPRPPWPPCDAFPTGVERPPPGGKTPAPLRRSMHRPRSRSPSYPPRPVLPARQPPAAKAGFTARPERRSPVGCNVRLQLPAAALTPRAPPSVRPAES